MGILDLCSIKVALQTKRSAAIPVLLLFAASTANAIDCTALKPEPPKNTDQTITGGLNGKIDGAFAKLAGITATAEGNYRSVSTYVLKELPQADKVYMWERVLYLQCQLMAESRKLTDIQKQETLKVLFQQALSAPPNSITNNGDKAVIVQGNSNNTTVNAK